MGRRRGGGRGGGVFQGEVASGARKGVVGHKGCWLGRKRKRRGWRKCFTISFTHCFSGSQSFNNVGVKMVCNAWVNKVWSIVTFQGEAKLGLHRSNLRVLVPQLLVGVEIAGVAVYHPITQGFEQVHWPSVSAQKYRRNDKGRGSAASETGHAST
jgi:hypothetical protein